MLILSINYFSISAASTYEGFTQSTPLRFNFVGEINKHSYIKLKLESTGDRSRHKQGILPVRGTFYEAVTGKTYRVIGSYTPETLIWKLDCFSNQRTLTSTFRGKENQDGGIEGIWTNRSTKRSFYLKRVP